MTHQHAALEETVYFWFASNDTSGSGNNGATPAAHVRLAGAGAAVAPVLSPTPTLLTNAAYPAGCHEVAVAATAANGFAANNTYAAFCTLAVDSQNPTGFIGSVTLAPIRADVVQSDGEDIKTALINIALAVPSVAPQPVSGNNVFRIQFACTDGAGDPVGIDAPLASNVIVVAVSETGVDRSGNVGTVVDDGQGVYHADYTVASTHPTEHVIFQIIATISGRARQSGLSQTFVGRVQTNVRAWQDYVLIGPAMIENDGSGNSRFTTKALEQGPSGGGGGLTAQQVWTYAGPEGRTVTGGTTTADNMRGTDNASTHSAADVWSVSLSEPSGRPSWAGMNYGALFGWLGVLNLNRRTQTDSLKTLRNDANTSDVATAQTSDDGSTYDHGRWQ